MIGCVNIKTTHFKFASILLLSFFVIAFIFSSNHVQAVTTVTVTDDWTWDDLKTAIEQTYKGQDVVININRSTPLSATSKITISDNSIVTLKCINNSHTTEADISREKSYHDNIFQVNGDSTLNLKCCLDGNYKDENDNIRGFFRTGKEEQGYYGKALICNYGTLNMDDEKSVLKNNYNALSTEELWSYNKINYYRIESDDTENGNCGSAILNINGSFNMENGQIYGCVADNGPAIFDISTGTENITLSNGKIFDNTACRNGGAIYISPKEPAAPQPVAIISGTIIENNLCRYSGGGVYVGNGNILQISDGEIHKNTALQENGGGIANEYITKITGGSFSDNYAGNNGGGIYNIGPAETINCEIYSNEAAGSGGGIFSTNNLKLEGVRVYDNYATIGSGVYFKTGKLEMVGSSLEGNGTLDTALSRPLSDYGGGLYLTNDGTEDITITESIITNNTSQHGGGVYIEKSNSPVLISSSEISHNTASHNGGGLFLENSDLFITENTHIKNNDAGSGGGVFVANGTVDMELAEIHENTAGIAGGIAFTNSASTGYIKNTKIYSNLAERRELYDPHAGGLSVQKGAVVNLLGGVEIYDNESQAYGAGAYVYGTLNISDDIDNDNDTNKIYSNKGQVNGTIGGGVFIGGTGVVNMENGEIYENTTKNNGAGVAVHGGGTFNMYNGSIHNNISNSNVHGVHIFAKSTFNMTDGEIYGNKKPSGTNWGVYVVGTKEGNLGTFKMSDEAIVKDDNTVFLELLAYITVPSEFKGDENIRAYIGGTNMVTGRVVAKYGEEETDKGSTALYHNLENPEMLSQYFTLVNGKILRSGDQGASTTIPEEIKDQDVFISENYSVNFDMNPEESMLSSTITHTIGEKDYVFNNLSQLTINKDVYKKYWNEELSFNPGHASCDDKLFNGWRDADDETARFTPDSTNIIAGNINKTVVIIAEWLSAIDIDYNGNGATDGDNWTEEQVKITGNYQLSDDNTTFTRQEAAADGTTRLFQHTGWSFEEFAIAKDYDFGATIHTSELKSYVTNIEGREREVATIYAVWDEFPTIKAVDRWFTLDEAQNGKITLEELMSTAAATDGIVGNPTNFTKALRGSEEFTVIDFNNDDFKAFTTSGNATVTYKAVDKVGNETYKTVVVHIVDKDEQKHDETTLFTRFISADYFKDTNEDFIASEYGGLKENSKWRTDSEYSSLLTSTLSNTKDGALGKWATVEETWNWSIDEIELCKSFIATHGVGNAENPNALNEFYNNFGPDN